MEISATPTAGFFFNDTATTEIYTLSLHDAPPIYGRAPDHPPRRRRRHVLPAGRRLARGPGRPVEPALGGAGRLRRPDRKSTRLNSSHPNISYVVFFLKKKSLQLHPRNDDATQTRF